MTEPARDGVAIVYCEGAFNTPNGKTAHGLVRFTQRYRVQSVIDSQYAGRDAREVLDGRHGGIPVFADLEQALSAGRAADSPPDYLVVGLAPDGGRLSAQARDDVKKAIQAGLHVDCGLHDFLSDDPVLSELAREKGVRIRDVRKPPPRDRLHFFSGKIQEVKSLKIALLGTDSAVGKRTTAWLLVHGLQKAGRSAEMIGTGQTAWMQGVRHGIVVDALISDFMSGEIEHAVWSAWNESRPDVIVLEGQGSLMNPAYPGGYELLAAGRPDAVVLQHAPARKEYDGFPGFPIHDLGHQIEAIRVVSGKPVVAVTVNHENIPTDEVAAVCRRLSQTHGLPVFDVLLEGPEGLVAVIEQMLDDDKKAS